MTEGERKLLQTVSELLLVLVSDHYGDTSLAGASLFRSLYFAGLLRDEIRDHLPPAAVAWLDAQDDPR